MTANIIAITIFTNAPAMSTLAPVQNRSTLDLSENKLKALTLNAIQIIPIRPNKGNIKPKIFDIWEEI